MPGMRGLTILVATADPERFHAALSFAAAQAALGGRSRVHLHGPAAALLDTAEPDLIALRAEAIALGVEFSACQTGLSGRQPAELPPGIEAEGPIGLLSRLEDDRLVVF